MTGLVVWWPFAIVDIPNGWAMCDGVDGRPDYRNYLLIGAGDLYTPGQVLGSITHQHYLDIDESVVIIQGYTESEYDYLDSGYDIDDAEGYGDYYYETVGHDHEIDLYGTGHDHTGVTDVQNHLPPCKAGCWIIKL